LVKSGKRARKAGADRWFSGQVIAWQKSRGRHDLPWQGTRDAYAIWVSEIMLQQTQVATVIPYYRRFMARFPDVAALASAPLDDVLEHWSGLGYYSRARHLHRAAETIRDSHDGCFPREVEHIAALPGIGRSTAAAIAVFATGARHAILDGNVKRVLARYRGVAGYPGEKKVADALWQAAEALLPARDVEPYTQGLMDLGATVCTRVKPRCAECPVRADCAALREDRVAVLPAPRPRKPLPHRSTVMLVLEHDGALLLEKRPAPGIWGGLWSFPESAGDEDLHSVCERRFGARIAGAEPLPDVEHGFTHFSLTISPRRVRVSALTPRAGESGQQWIAIDAVNAAAVPAPVRTIVASLCARQRELPLHE
jgi:A/G-specific adenine glycosylase